MNSVITGTTLAEADIFTYNISDEAIEAAAGTNGLDTTGCQCSLGSCSDTGIKTVYLCGSEDNRVF